MTEVDVGCEAAAVIVHWGDPGRTLTLVAELSRRPTFDRIVVVANDGTARPPAASEACRGTVLDWMLPTRNLGYGAACHFAAIRVPARRYAFLNNDLVISPEAARACLDALDLPGIGLSGPVLLHPDGRLQSGCGSFSRWLRAPRVQRWPHGDYERCRWLTGAALFARGEVVHAVRFDGSYFLGYEDSDLCERAASAGWAAVCVSAAVGEHAGYTTIAGARWQYYAVRNRIWFCRRRRSRAAAAAVWLWLVSAMLPRVTLADVAKRRGLERSRSVFWGVVDGIGPLPPFGTIRPDEPVPQRWLRW